MLQLAPLCKNLRQQIQRKQIPLDDSIPLMVDASFLVLTKVQYLLPVHETVEDETKEENQMKTGELLEKEIALLDEFEFATTVSVIGDLVHNSALSYRRGCKSFLQMQTCTEVTAIETQELACTMSLLIDRMVPRKRSVVVLKRNFSEHLKWFWKEVTRLASEYVVLRFSLFVSSSAQDSVLNFLVLLELVKRRRLFAKQPDIFGDIIFSTKRKPLSKL